MMKLVWRKWLRRAGLAALLFLAACGSGLVDLSTLAPDDLYAEASEAYADEDWDQVIRLAEYFVSENIGDPRAPDARMMLGAAYRAQEDYATAATHYQRLVIDFPTHPRALEARFLICDSYYQLSPDPALDQEYTVSALLNCQSVADNYPGTPEAEKADAYVVELRHKLAQKVYDTGMFYFKRQAYNSAAVYFEQAATQFPTTTVAPAALAQLVETYERIGYVEDAEAARDRLLEDYPQSPEAQALQA